VKEHDSVEGGFASEFMAQRHRDQDIENYHLHAEGKAHSNLESEEKDWYSRYEDPHMHPTFGKASDLEKRPEKDDFFSYDWATIHAKPLKETHLMPPQDAKDIKKVKAEETKVPSKANEWMPYSHADNEEYPVYPHEASIFYDVKNGYDIYYDPNYEPAKDYSHYDRMYLGKEGQHANTYKPMFEEAFPHSNVKDLYTSRRHLTPEVERESHAH